MKLSEAEWTVMEILWKEERWALKDITQELKPIHNWNKNTVYTYLTRMETKGLVHIDHALDKPYSAQVTREQCASKEREELLHKVYNGATGDLIAAFLKESSITQKEVEQLKKLLDDMEV